MVFLCHQQENTLFGDVLILSVRRSGLLGVNNNGDVLLRATGLASSTDYQYWLYKSGVYTRITVPNYTILNAVGISDDGSILVNIYNSENFGANYRVALVKP